MKLLRFGEKGQESPGTLDGQGNIRDLSGIVSDFNAKFLASGGLEKLTNVKVDALPLVEGTPRLAEPVANAGKMICVGLNYSDHAKEAGMEVPPEPVIFFKATSSITGPNDNVELPPNSEKSDWEVELAVVIGKQAKYVSEADALDYVAGYSVVNDLSEREYQIERHGQWCKGKGCDTFGPIGPYLVTPDEVPDPHNLNIWLELNGERMQDGNTRTMVYNIAYIVSYLSQFMSLQPGDIISTGTPPGVGLGMNPPRYLNEGDVMRLGIEGLGVQEQKVVRYRV